MASRPIVSYMNSHRFMIEMKMGADSIYIEFTHTGADPGFALGVGGSKDYVRSCASYEREARSPLNGRDMLYGPA